MSSFPYKYSLSHPGLFTYSFQIFQSSYEEDNNYAQLYKSQQDSKENENDLQNPLSYQMIQEPALLQEYENFCDLHCYSPDCSQLTSSSTNYSTTKNDSFYKTQYDNFVSKPATNSNQIPNSTMIINEQDNMPICNVNSDEFLSQDNSMTDENTQEMLLRAIQNQPQLSYTSNIKNSFEETMEDNEPLQETKVSLDLSQNEDLMNCIGQRPISQEEEHKEGRASHSYSNTTPFLQMIDNFTAWLMEWQLVFQEKTWKMLFNRVKREKAAKKLNLSVKSLDAVQLTLMKYFAYEDDKEPLSNFEDTNFHSFQKYVETELWPKMKSKTIGEGEKHNKNTKGTKIRIQTSETWKALYEYLKITPHFNT